MEPVHYDTTARSVKKGFLYTNNGFWDTYKTVYPLYSIIAPKEYEEMLEGFLNSYRETGFLPKWLSPDERGLMPGTLIDAVIADAAAKGLAQHLLPELLEAMLTAATTQSGQNCYGRQGTLDYIKYGYVPSSYHERESHAGLRIQRLLHQPCGRCLGPIGCSRPIRTKRAQLQKYFRCRNRVYAGQGSGRPIPSGFQRYELGA